MENVTVRGDVVAVPEVTDGLSQVGTPEIEYWNEDGENGPP
jgi:signal peptidase I